MRVIAVVSMKGGVGKTTLTANLACALALARAFGPVLTIDLDPQNAMHWHLGLNASTAPGICSLESDNESWASRILPSPIGVGCMPYGSHGEATRLEFEQRLADDPQWLNHQLQQAGFPKESTILIDTPPGPTVYLQQACQAASAALAVILSDAASYATLPAMNAWISTTRNAAGSALQTWYVLNQVDLTDPLNHDVCELLTNQLGSMLAPVRIHRDESVCESLVFQKSVLEYAPQAQSSLEFNQLAHWLGQAVCA